MTALDLNTILPNVSTKLTGTGSLFGSGTSYEAGYPMMPGLTRHVMSALTPDERAVIDEVLAAQSLTYDPSNGEPNIEQLSDLVIAHHINSGDTRFAALEARMRFLIVECLHSVTALNLDHHCQFFEALRHRAFGHPHTVWIFTPNYDLLFEMAAARCGVTLENGFCGTTHRFFDPAMFDNVVGKVVANRFAANNSLTVKLVKLHGSISWIEEASKTYEHHPAAIKATATRVMVLPRRKKVMDTLAPPYDRLFGLVSRILGTECKYLASCGFSFSDEHINQTLLLPAMQAAKCKLFALSQVETPGMAAFKSLPNFQAGFEMTSLIGGSALSTGTDLWKFSEFVKIF